MNNRREVSRPPDSEEEASVIEQLRALRAALVSTEEIAEDIEATLGDGHDIPYDFLPELCSGVSDINVAYQALLPAILAYYMDKITRPVRVRTPEKPTKWTVFSLGPSSLTKKEEFE